MRAKWLDASGGSLASSHFARIRQNARARDFATAPLRVTYPPSMITTSAALVSLIQAHGDVATDTEVEAQGQYFYPGTWRKSWPHGLDMPAILADAVPGDGKKHPVTRSDIFKRAENVDTEADALDLYVLMCGWGAGWQGITGYRCRRPLHSPDVAAKLLAAHRAIRAGEDPKAVYASLQPGGTNHIKYFGPAFFTKWLYFSGYGREGVGGKRPLILDARVARSLGWDSWGWTSTQYDQYLELAAAAAKELGVGPQVVEYVLYSMNGTQTGTKTDPDAQSLIIEDVPDALYRALIATASAQQEPIQDVALTLLARALDVTLEGSGV